MKKLLLFSMFCMLSMMSYAESVTFSWEGASTDTGKSDGWEATQNGVTLAFWKNAGSNVPATNKEGSVRLYNGSKLIISAPSGCNITSVAFTPTSNTYSATNLKYNGTALTSDTWTLDDPVSSVELVAAAANEVDGSTEAKDRFDVARLQGNDSSSAREGYLSMHISPS